MWYIFKKMANSLPFKYLGHYSWLGNQAIVRSKQMICDQFKVLESGCIGRIRGQEVDGLLWPGQSRSRMGKRKRSWIWKPRKTRPRVLKVRYVRFGQWLLGFTSLSVLCLGSPWLQNLEYRFKEKALNCGSKIHLKLLPQFSSKFI